MRQRVMSYSGLLFIVPDVYIASLLMCNYTSWLGYLYFFPDVSSGAKA